jgi:hypothetical protein
MHSSFHQSHCVKAEAIVGAFFQLKCSVKYSKPDTSGMKAETAACWMFQLLFMGNWRASE